MKKLGMILIGMTLPLSFACAEDTAAMQKLKTIEFAGSTFTRLEGTKLSSTLINKKISRDSNLAEKYYDNGAYESTGALVPVQGKYKIFDTKFCVSRDVGDKVSRCREIYVDGQGQHIVQEELSSERKIIYAVIIGKL